ncbi:MAG: YheT family hydrolase [Vicinamibacteria bacterium]
MKPEPTGRSAPFSPHPLAVGAHRQTLLGYLLRRRLRWPHAFDEDRLEAAPDVRLLLRSSWQPRPRECPTLVLVHGLGGSSEGSYGISTGLLAFARGWNVVRMNMRGAGDGETLCPLLYNAGLDEDLLAVVRWAAERSARVAVAGFSLGANQALLLAGRRAATLPAALFAVAAVSAPLDLSACTDALDAPRNRLYQRHYVGELVAAYRRRQRRRPDLYAAGLEKGITSIREYDDRITAPHCGYRDAADYYARSSSGPWLGAIARPTLVLGALDDPMIPAASVTRFALRANSPALRELMPTGGHVGFVAPARAPGWFWAADRVLDFFDGVAERAA